MLKNTVERRLNIMSATCMMGMCLVINNTYSLYTGTGISQ
jgi:hypothetical protein